MEKVTDEIKCEIRNMVFTFFAEECERDISQITDLTNVIDDLDGDSLLFIELLQLIKKKYNLSVSMQNVGKYMLQNRTETIGKVIDLMIYILENENSLK